MRYRFGDLEADIAQRELRHHGERVALEPQAFDVLVHLLRHRDRVVPKEELMDEVWGGRFVSETAVTSRIKQVRRALGDDGTAQTHVRTYHGRGYRFVADASESDGPTSPSTRAAHVHDAAPSPVLRLASGRDATWQVVGQGPPDLLVLPGAATWDEGAGLVAGLATMSRVIRFEGRDAAVEVMDEAASPRAVLLAEGAAWAAAARLHRGHPQRVSGLVVVGPEEDPESWGALSSLDVPAVVVHHADDPVSPVSVGRRLAAALPQGEFCSLPGAGHTAADDPDRVVEAIADLVETVAASEAAEQELTALVGLAGQDVDALAAVLVDLGGRVRRGPEQHVVVSFDGPAQAFRALGSRRARGLVDEVGVGVAIDEVSRTDELVSGHGVDVARFLARVAAPGEVLLPNVIKSLLAGSGLSVTTLDPVELPYVGHHPVHRWNRR